MFCKSRVQHVLPFIEILITCLENSIKISKLSYCIVNCTASLTNFMVLSSFTLYIIWWRLVFFSLPRPNVLSASKFLIFQSSWLFPSSFILGHRVKGFSHHNYDVINRNLNSSPDYFVHCKCWSLNRQYRPYGWPPRYKRLCDFGCRAGDLTCPALVANVFMYRLLPNKPEPHNRWIGEKLNALFYFLISCLISVCLWVQDLTILFGRNLQSSLLLNSSMLVETVDKRKPILEYILRLK